ncbi:MAG TPA: hypothetical protein VNH18_07395 [Bryobacteraceae bacterium]|nr:hypothetical protein [Bryobacteraceae bacterium]
MANLGGINAGEVVCVASAVPDPNRHLFMVEEATPMTIIVREMRWWEVTMYRIRRGWQRASIMALLAWDRITAGEPDAGKGTRPDGPQL